MIHDILSQFGSSVGPRIALIIFVALFVGILIWTYRGRRDRFERISRLPLDDDDVIESLPDAGTHAPHEPLGAHS